MGSLIGGKKITVGFRYFMSLHMGLCRGPIDEIVQINVGEVRAWPIPDGNPNTEKGLATIAQGPGGKGVKIYENGNAEIVPPNQINTYSGPGNGSFQINAENLFGGDKKEGGIRGNVQVMMGGAAQVIPNFIKTRLGGRVPEFRGLLSIFYDGLLCSLNPYPKPWMFRVRRTESGWDGDVWHPELATIWLANGAIKAMNPIHIIYECLTNRSWARGFPRSFIDDESFLASAQQIYDEGFGLCLRWNRQDQLSSFVQEVIDHIGAVLYADRMSGLIKISLLRNNYDVDALPLFTYDTGLLSIEEDETVSRDDLVNEIIVNWHDPLKNEDRQSRFHNLASLQSLGATKPSDVTYDGIPVAKLAAQVGQRDMRATSTSLKRYKVVLDRRAWKVIPGSVFKIQARDRGIEQIVLRAGKVGQNGDTNGEITINAVVDVFGLPATTFVSEQPSEWQPPDRTAVVIADRIVREATYGEYVQSLSPADLALVDPSSGSISVVAARPSGLSQTYGIATKVDAEEYEKRGAGAYVPFVKITANIGPYTTVVPFNNGADLGLVQLKSALQIDDEIVRLDDITSDGISGTITIARGCADTVPAAHTSGAPVFFTDGDFAGDGREYVQGEDVSVKLLNVTSTQELPIEAAYLDAITIRARQARPWPPANVRVNGTPFGDLTTVSGSITLSWVHRSRLLIKDQLVAHGAAGVGPEAGTTYAVRVFDGPNDSVPNRVVTGITGTSWDYAAADMIADGLGSIVVLELEAVRGGMTSLFKYRFSFTRGA